MYIRIPLSFVHLKQIMKLVIIICAFSYILIVLHSYLNVTYHIGLYTGGGFSCNCNLARLLVKGGAIGVVANSLLERGESGGS